MPKITLSQKWVEAALRKPPGQRTDFFDAATPGLCLTIGPQTATWYLFRRVDGKLTRLTLGPWSELGIQPARAKVAEIDASIAAGRHPKADQARERAAVSEARTLDHSRVFATAAEAWAKQHFPSVGESSRRDYRRELDRLIAAFPDRDIASITRGEFKRHLDKITKSSANRAAVVIRQLYSYARDRLDLPLNPVADLPNPHKQTARKRTLSRDEIRILWTACELAGYPYGHALRMALCTAQRIGEVGAFNRRDRHGDWWAQEENKSDRRIDVYLASHARKILTDCPNFGADKFFFSASGGDQGIRSDTWTQAITRHITPQIEKAAKKLKLPTITKHWTAHDLRRTVRTGLTGWCHVSPDTAERVLNHAITGIRGVYDWADYRPHVQDALTRWDEELTLILAGKAGRGIPTKGRKTARTG